MNKIIKQAFTLIELLVVIAIIGILSGLIVVSMGGMTDKATIAKAQVFSNSLRNSLMLNLISEWRFDEINVPSASKTPDSWSGGNTATLYGPSGSQNLPQLQTTGCVSGNCLRFDGTDDYLSVVDNDSLDLSYITIEVWVKYEGTGTETIISKRPLSNDASFFVYRPGDNSLQVYINVSNGGWESIVRNNVAIGVWHHIATTYNGSAMRLFLDGAEVSGSPLLAGSGAITPSASSLEIGRDSLDSGAGFYNRCFTGFIDNIRIYDKAMPTSQIKENYYAGLNSLLANGNINAMEYNERINSIAKQ